MNELVGRENVVEPVDVSSSTIDKLEELRVSIRITIERGLAGEPKSVL